MSTEKRKIFVRLWIKAWGEEYGRIVEVDAPLVSNQPCPNIQREADHYRARAAAMFSVEQGFEILPNDRDDPAGRS